MRKGKVKEVLEMMLWKPGEDPSSYEIIFVSRGAPGDLESVRGDQVRLWRDRLVLGDGREIPLHRVVEVRRGGVPLYRRGRG